MGKSWHRQHGGGKGGGKQSHDLPSCKGYPVVMATCDPSRERESSKELVNILQEAIEQLYPELVVEVNKAQTSKDRESMSFEQLMQAEIQEVREQKHSFQKVHSIQTNIKGIVLVKILAKEVCPVRLTIQVFDQINHTKQNVCRHLVRLMPLQCVFYPNDEDFANCFKFVVNANMGVREETVAASSAPTPAPPAAAEEAQQTSVSITTEEAKSVEQTVEDVQQDGNTDETNLQKRPLDGPITDDTATPAAPNKKPKPAPTPLTFTITPVSPPLPCPFSYSMHFKARNSNSLSREVVYATVGEELKSRGGFVYSSRPSLTVLVEAVKNIAGIAWIRGKKAGGGEKGGYEEYEGFNIRKWQGQVTGKDDAVATNTANSASLLEGGKINGGEAGKEGDDDLESTGSDGEEGDEDA